MVKELRITDNRVEQLGEYMGKFLLSDMEDMLTDAELDLFEKYIRASSDKALYASINDIHGDLYDENFDTAYIKEYVKELDKQMGDMYFDMLNEIERGLKLRIEDLAQEMMYQFELAHGAY